jgi:hypothetical protein
VVVRRTVLACQPRHQPGSKRVGAGFGVAYDLVSEAIERKFPRV